MTIEHALKLTETIRVLLTEADTSNPDHERALLEAAHKLTQRLEMAIDAIELES